jgi:flagellar biogenesis protein FliO
MMRWTAEADSAKPQPAGGLAIWLLDRLRRSLPPQPRLALVERITLAPRHSLALVEAEGRRFLVATSQDSGPAFYALDGQYLVAGKPRQSRIAGRGRRITW